LEEEEEEEVEEEEEEEECTKYTRGTIFLPTENI